MLHANHTPPPSLHVLKSNPLLTSYVALLKKWGQNLNLVALPDLEHDTRLWQRHIHDAALLLPFIKTWPRFIDMGSGAGLPGVVLSILTQDMDNIPAAHLVEANHKRIVFLDEVRRTLNLPLTLHHDRLEKVSLEPPYTFVSRAFRPLKETLALMQPYLIPETVYVCLKGASYQEDVARAQEGFVFDLEVFKPLAHGETRALRLTHIEKKRGTHNIASPD